MELAQRYNTQDTLIMISSYPARKDRTIKNLNAVASYADHLTPELTKAIGSRSKKLVILAEILENAETYEENDVLVVRCWKRNNKRIFPQILNTLTHFSRSKNIFIQFEFNMFGGSFITLLFPIFLLALKIKKIKTTVLLHQVLLDLRELSNHIGLSKKTPKIYLLNAGLKLFYGFVLNIADNIIVHEEILKKRLLTVKKRNIEVISHGLGEYKTFIDVTTAREKFGIPKDSFVILIFGFITWYKGSDWFVKTFNEMLAKTKNRNILLIVGGGASANLQNQEHYVKYYNDVIKDISTNPNILHTGFIPDSMVPYCFGACDLVVLPYRVQMSASGPLALAINFDKPFILSDNLAGMLMNEDIKLSLERNNLTKNDVLFSLNEKSFGSKLLNMVNNPQKINKLTRFCEDLKLQRNWKIISEKFAEVIYNHE